MRLLRVADLTFKTFVHPTVPRYAIASHRWYAGEEASLQDVQRRANTGSRGYRKIEAFCRFARDHVRDIEWLWIDTCCIDTGDAVELQAAINDMFRWYRAAAVCLAYLHDVPAAEDADANDDDSRGGDELRMMDALRHSEWFHRGWTLQELLAPRLVVFLSADWRVIGHKANPSSSSSSSINSGPKAAAAAAAAHYPLHVGRLLNETIAAVTGIPAPVLADYEQSKALAVEERLSWMRDRDTTRPEDMAYCLLGVFDVDMPLFYGETGDEARTRLRQAIARREGGE